MPGDDMRHVDWKIFGRSDRYFLRQYDDETSSRVQIVLDCSRSMNFHSDSAKFSKWEYCLLLAGALTWLGLTQGNTVGVSIYSSTNQFHLSPAGTLGQFRKVQRLTDGLAPEGKTDFAHLERWLPKHIGKRAIVFLISDFFDDVSNIERLLKRLQFDRHDVSVVQLSDPMEVSGPERDMDFVDSESGRTLSADSSRIRQSYQEIYQRFLSGVQSLSARTKAICQLATTNEDPSRVLRALMQRRQR